MSYAIVDLELTEPLPGLELKPGEAGALILLRAQGRPVDYGLHALAPGTRLAPDELWALVGRGPGLALIEDAVRRELAPPTDGPAVDLTVAVCTRARPELLERCLRSVLALREPGGSDLAVLVVDNDPPDDATEALVTALGGIAYVREPRAGLDFARNRALAEARTEWLAFVDDDAVLDHGWRRGLEEAVAENPDAGMVTGLVLPVELETGPQIAFEHRGGFGRGARKLRFTASSGQGDPLYPLGSGIFGAGCNMVVRTEAIRSLGGFDEALDTGPPLPGGGDLDIFYRTLRAGHALAYEPRMLAFHHHRRDHAGLRRQYWSWGEGFMAYLSKTSRAEPGERRRAARLVAWWLGYETRLLAQNVRPRASLSPDLCLAELAGGLVGLAGSYDRSRRRVAKINEAHA